ncbi:MAG TPA: tRNA pseudouridine(13) synthase TruD [Planctomycetota bacterium]|nr:tRNA pseudouridine(13) synthase TruD [Planctomycetota bacterium]
MKLKARLEDFVVRERYDLRGLSSDGRFTVYRVEKRNLSTIEAALRLAAAARVPADAVRFAGLKDRRAVTEQTMSVEDAPPVEIDDEDLRAHAIGWSPRPIRSDRLEGNDFEIVARDLTREEAAILRAGLDEVVKHGLPSYFDDQRFGAARAGKGWPALEVLRGRHDEALRLLVAVPSAIDGPEHAERKKSLAAAWGDWPRCAALARGWHERSTFEHLERHAGDFAGALRFVPRRERVLQLFAWQSRVWNGALDALVRARVDSARRCEIETEMGNLAAWRRLEPAELARLEAIDLRLPDRRTRPSDPEVAAALTASLARDGLALDDLGAPTVRGFQLREERRPCVLRPTALASDDPVADELHPGRLRVAVRLSLPRGAYATLVMKRAIARS